ncbi:MAG: creatininase family protein [Acidimicrobiales bacterium]
MTIASRRLAELRASDLGDKLSADSILVLPLGAIEQHGPHLPFNTDLVIAERCASAVVDQAGEALDLWLMEPLAYTKSNEHAGTPGTVWLGPETMLRVLDDIGRSVAATPARKLAILNGHGGNSSLLNVACRELRLNHNLETFLLHPSLPPDQGGSSDPIERGASDPIERGVDESSSSELGMGIHAGMAETSIMLHLRPELVRMDLATRNVPEHLDQNEHVRFGGTVTFGWLAADFGDNGIIGDPTGANEPAGAALFKQAVEQLIAAFGEIKEFRFK